MQQSYQTALYIRLSILDSGKTDSDTLETQEQILREFIKDKKEFSIQGVYSDNGFTGTSFQRPAFQQMLEAARAGRINCILVKDLSRLGRNYLEIGEYLEIWFPKWQIRFISVNDRIDTQIDISNMLELPLKNIINEAYAKDSSRKIISALTVQKQEGRHGGGLAPYGYRKSKTNKGSYEIDKEAAKMVRLIFSLRAKGYGYGSIVNELNKRGIKSPSLHRDEQGEKLRTLYTQWKTSDIRDMLRDEVYLGHMLRGKTRVALYQEEKRHALARADWVVSEHTHQAILTKALFDKVQAVNKAQALKYTGTRKTQAAPQQENKEEISTTLRQRDSQRRIRLYFDNKEGYLREQ